MLVLIVLASVSAATGGIGPQGEPAACKYEENCDCAAPGITVRWKAAYCMILNATDDYEQDGVSECMNRLDPPALRSRTACEHNVYWKQQFCRVRHEGDERRAQVCVDDPAMIPRTVEFGIGGTLPPPDHRKPEQPPGPEPATHAGR